VVKKEKEPKSLRTNVKKEVEQTAIKQRNK
jgi:hypothetical protein